MAFAATDAVAGLKMIDNGMPKERLALLGVPMIPIQIILPLIISKYTGGSEPLKVFMRAYPFRYVLQINIILISTGISVRLVCVCIGHSFYYKVMTVFYSFGNPVSYC